MAENTLQGNARSFEELRGALLPCETGGKQKGRHMPDTFKFSLSQKVCHQDALGDTFTIIRRWLDVDLPAGENRFYMLRADKPLLGYNTVGPVPEAELSPVTD